MQQDIPYLSVIIPSYRSAEVLERNLPVFMTYLNTLKKSYEIIVVDDGSNDQQKTKNVVERLGCRYAENPKNMGKGAAVKRGMLASSGRFKIFTDSDIPYEYEAIQAMLYYLDEKEFDMVVGDRKLKQSVYFEDMSLLRNIGSKVFSFIVGLFIVGGWYDTQCGIKGFKKEAADKLFSLCRIKGFAMDVELFSIAIKKDYDIKRISVKLRSKEGTSVKVFKHGMMMVGDLLRVLLFKIAGKYNG